jgi:hypothetical protein
VYFVYAYENRTMKPVMSEHLSFLCLNYILLYVETTFLKSIHLLMDTWVLFCFNTGGWTALHLLCRRSTIWATPLTLFALVILGVVSCFLPSLLWQWSSYLHFPSSWNDRRTPPCPVIGWDEFSLTFLPRLAVNHNSPDLCFPNS